MKQRIVVSGIAVMVFCLHTPAMSANFTINNPAEKIDNPADRIYNPASHIDNPASNIYNPASRMDNPNPLSPPTQPVPKPVLSKETTAETPAEQVKEKSQPHPKSESGFSVPAKVYNFKTVNSYIIAAKKAFIKDNYLEFLSITEDALRRINAGSLNTSTKSKQKLEKYKVFGYGLL